MRLGILLLCFPLTASAQRDMPLAGARDLAYAPDGRLALSVRGDLWIVSSDQRWIRVTSGPEWDRHPAWSTDGRSLVFASNRGGAGNFDIWQVALGDSGAARAPMRVLGGREDEDEPTVAGDGRILFVRGRGSAARLWMRERDGSERRLTSGRVAERWPVVSPDGQRVAYVAVSESGRRLVVRSLAATAEQRGADSTIVSASGIERPAWSPNGDRLTYTVGGIRHGLFVVPTDGRYTNLVSTRHAASAWTPDGRRLALVELPDDDVDYNGDPDRVGDRDAHDLLAEAGGLWMVDAPTPPDAGLAAAPAVAKAPFGNEDERTRHNKAALDELASRMAELYYSAPSFSSARAKWQSLVSTYRGRAVAARDDEELRGVLHALLRERPLLREPATGRAAISSAHPVATAAGLEILRKGGNVVDAAAAVSFALGVVEPDASGPGGYGQMLVYRTTMVAPQLIEFMTRVPEEAGLDNASLLQNNGRLPDDGPVLANVPGTVAAMYLAVKKYGSGRIPWADILAPAIRAARDGYVVSEGLATTLATEREHFLKYDASRALFFRNGQPLQAGDTLHNPDLAWTLEQIAKGGADAFYRGEIARRIVADLRGKGNAMQLSDLSRYFAAEREPVQGSYRGYTLYSSAPPVAGGAQLASTLALLENYKDPKPYTEDAATLHAMLSAWLLVPSSRNRIADPGLWPVTLEPFTNPDTARARWRCFDPAKALGPEIFRSDSLTCAAPKTAEGNDANDDALHFHHAAGTTAFMVADADGNVVAVTQTLGTWGGNFYVTPGLGFLYNDKLASYGTDPNAYGARLPFARHGSTIAPTIVFRGEAGRKPRPIAAVGAAGNAWITSAVYETLVGIIDQHLGPQQALELPRFLPGFRGPDGFTLEIEDGFAPEVMRRLVSLGYRPRLVSLLGELREGYGAALILGNGSVTAGADPRRAGAAGAIP